MIDLDPAGEQSGAGDVAGRFWRQLLPALVAACGGEAGVLRTEMLEARVGPTLAAKGSDGHYLELGRYRPATGLRLDLAIRRCSITAEYAPLAETNELVAAALELAAHTAARPAGRATGITEPCLILDADRNILEVNEGAMRILASNGVVSPLTPRFREPRLQAALDSAIDLARMRPASSIQVTATTDEGLHCVSAWLLEPWFARSNIFVTISPLPPTKPTKAAFAEQYALTAAESDLAIAIASGRSLSQFAVDRGIAYGTVRVQLRSIFAKVGVNRQAALVRLMLETRNPL